MTHRPESRGQKSVLRTVFRFAVRHWARRKGSRPPCAPRCRWRRLTEIFVPVLPAG
jgi:hypothetical protein